MDQRHVAASGVDQLPQVGFRVVLAHLAPDQHAGSVERGVGRPWWSAGGAPVDQDGELNRAHSVLS
jgi:hypothetical protein